MVRTQLRSAGVQACKLLGRCLLEAGLAFATLGIGFGMPPPTTKPKKETAEAAPLKLEIKVTRAFGNTADEDEGKHMNPCNLEVLSDWMSDGFALCKVVHTNSLAKYYPG
jgi:hypothetical protein